MNISIDKTLIVNGQKGIGISTAIVNESGNLIITLTDNSTLDAGQVKGLQGDTGLGIQSATLTDGNLIITLTDNSTVNAGVVIGPQGSTGPQGDSVINANIDNSNQVTITLSDGSTVDAGTVAASSFEPCDILLTARNNIDPAGFIELDRYDTVTTNKTNDLEIWNHLKQYNDNHYAVPQNSDPEHFSDTINTINHGQAANEAVSVYKWKNKWIRILSHNTKTIFHVSTDFSFTTFNEYTLTDASTAIYYNIMFLPEINRIIYCYSSYCYFRILTIDDADDLANYEVGGVNYPLAAHNLSGRCPSSNYLRTMNLDRPADDPNCKMMIHMSDTSASTQSYLVIHDLSDLDNLVANCTIHKISDINSTLGVNVLARHNYNYKSGYIYLEPMISNGRIYFYDLNSHCIVSCDLSISDLRVEIVSDSLSIGKHGGLNFDGSLYYNFDDTGFWVLNSHNGDTSFTNCTSVNPNVSTHNLQIVAAVPHKNVIFAKTNDVTGMTGNQFWNEWWVTFDNGVTWINAFDENEYSNTDQNLSNISSYSTRNNYWGWDSTGGVNSGDFVMRSYSGQPLLNGINYTSSYDRYMLMNLIEQGYSDLIKMLPVDLNNQLKAYVKR